VVGGRAYFEANVFGFHTQQFTTKGFFDKANYVEPEGKASSSKYLAVIIVVPLVIVAIILVIVFVYYRKKKQAKVKYNHID
jgi:phosphotransferase system  glucose/maltose/N-acetylglucosamine-specific IIC component